MNFVNLFYELGVCDDFYFNKQMSAKMAEQQLKEIQSESQRLARQLHVR